MQPIVSVDLLTLADTAPADTALADTAPAIDVPVIDVPANAAPAHTAPAINAPYVTELTTVRDRLESQPRQICNATIELLRAITMLYLFAVIATMIWIFAV